MPRTFRELVWAYRGKEYAEWERLSVLLCAVVNPNRDTKKHPLPFIPTDFFRRPGSKSVQRGGALTGNALRALKAAIVKRGDQ